MQFAELEDVTLCFESFGAHSDPAVVLVMGLATQMIGWDRRFCEGLALQGYRVIRFDNRDIGLSSKFHGHGQPNVLSAFLRRQLRVPVKPGPYSLSHMARDIRLLLDFLRIDSAHVVGISMGGMIAQTFAADYPTRARSLVSWNSSPGEPHLPIPHIDAIRVLLKRPPRTRDEAADRLVAFYRAVGSPKYFDPERIALRAYAEFDRSRYGSGTARQLHAVLSSPPRTALLRTLGLPTTVIHGVEDRLVPIAHGAFTASVVPGARFSPIPDYGHDLAEPLWDQLLGELKLHLRWADARWSGT